MSPDLSPRSIVVGVTMLLAMVAVVPALAAPDLDVCYISRTPRYYKYLPEYQHGVDPKDYYNGKPYLTETDQARQRWPRQGETVTFTAAIKNAGDSPTGEFAYKWLFDGQEVASGTLPSVEPGGRTSATYQWTWDSEWNDHTIKFVADPDNLVAEIRENNNSREDRVNALSFRIHVWQSVYDWFKTEAPEMNPQIAGFEDWIQNQIGSINRMFQEAVYPSSPNGILERVRLDEVVVEPNDAEDPDPNACHAPANEQWDCRWGFGPKEYPRIFVEERPDFISQPYTWVMHEFGHQMGLIDIYQLFLDKERNHVQPSMGHMVSRVGDLMSSTAQLQYSDFTAVAMNANLHKRRGYFGEYLYDVPRTCKVRLLDAYGNPLPNATINFYQDHGHEVNAPHDFSGVTDAEGLFALPNRSVSGEITTGTGHILHDNPWGVIYVVGFNSLFFCEILAEGQKDYQFIEIIPFNLAYNRGHKDEWTYDLQTTIVPRGRVTTQDPYAIKMLSDSLGYAVGAVGTILEWDGTRWSAMSSPTTQALLSVDGIPGLICAVGGHGTVITLSNGAWTPRDIGALPNLRACAVAHPSTILVGGERGELFRSIDGGATWSKVSATENNIRSLQFATASDGIMLCEGGKAYYTTDAGANWAEAKGDFGSGPLVDCCISSPTEAWACGDKGRVYFSEDTGKTWSLFNEFGSREEMYGIAMRPGATGWCAGVANPFFGTVPIKRIENGKWKNESVTTHGASDVIYDISGLTADSAWAVGKGGLLLHLLRTEN